MSDIKVMSYTPQIHESLKQFMVSQYPNRSEEYISWWLNDILNGDQEVWDRTKVVFYRENIVGCTTTKKGLYAYKDERHQMFYEANTIVSLSMRGKGIGKLLYSYWGQYSDRCVIGMTDTAYNIQAKQLKNTSIILDPIRVYITVNWKIIFSLIGMLNKGYNSTLTTPPSMTFMDTEFTKISSFNELNIINNGIWTNEEVEICRDLTWLENRFINIWRKSEYHKYSIERHGEQIGYVVYRKTQLFGLNFIAIVDYRCSCKKYEKYIFHGANNIAKLNNIGAIICLSSRKYNAISFYPFTIRTPKRIKGLASNTIKRANILFTSADSDLDFVYYK